MYGEKIVLRILDPVAQHLALTLGYEPEQKAPLDAIQCPYGMVLVTVSDGLWETALRLYTGLNIPEQTRHQHFHWQNIPAEIPLPGINQVNIDDKQGSTFPGRLLRPSCGRIRISSWSARDP
ncbi:MAG: hypothetical protein IPI21_11770 [Propionivibrio sp.]|nr:hypothetical protein [Propionivibrio sp.]